MIGSLDDAVRALRAGLVVAVPTDTVYGVAATLDHAPRLFEVKQRPREVALPVLVGSREQVRGIVALPLHDAAAALVERWWPGPLTIVLDRDPSFDVDLGGSGDAAHTVGVRWPAAEVIDELCGAVGPLAVTSANLHGRPTPPDAPGVEAMLGDAVAVVVDGGRCEGTPSTVVRVHADGKVEVLREGGISGEELSRPLPRASGAEAVDRFQS